MKNFGILFQEMHICCNQGYLVASLFEQTLRFFYKKLSILTDEHIGVEQKRRQNLNIEHELNNILIRVQYQMN